ncbi:MAG: hypothetical protein LAQ69_42555 [Acidobacteriia bacterium]|nr:hypothetical protein [Terriglobia bacterium]
MRRAFPSILTAGLFFFSASASAQTFVQAAAQAASGSVSSLSSSFPSNTVTGNLILVGFNFNANATPSSVTDSQGNVFTQVGSQLTSPGGIGSRVYYAKNIKGGTDTVTINLSASANFFEVYLAEYSGVDQAAPLDAQAGASGNAGAVSSGNATTTVAGDLIYGYCLGDSACTVGSGFTARSTLNSNLIEDMPAGNPGAYAATGSANSGWTMQMVALKPASSSPPSVPTNACDLATPYGSPDSADVQAAINMVLGTSPCTANIIGPNVCNVVVVQRVVNATPPPSGTNTCLTGSGASSHSVALNWVASTTPNVTYSVYRAATSGGYSPTPLASLIAGTSYTDTTVLAGQTYFYVIKAADSNNNLSTASNEATAVIPTP